MLPDSLANKYWEEEGFDLIDAHTIPIVDINGMGRDSRGGLGNRPHCYYVFTFRIADRIIVIGVRSTGKIKVLETFHDMPYGLDDYNAS